jgi:7-cyano-7-deazaguanine synthase
MMSNPLAVVSLSGGMDSSTLLAHMLDTEYDVIGLSFNYGQRHVKELDAAREIAKYYDIEYHIVDLRSVGRLLTGSALTDDSVEVPEGHYEADTMKATVVPNRNAIMANIAIGVASARGAECVCLGIHAGDHAVYPDCRPEWVATLRHLAAASLDGFHTPRIDTPFVNRTKTDIARIAGELLVPLGKTWSCYKGGEKHCGRCGTCVERIEAIRDAGIDDPTEYEDKSFAEAVLA